MNALGALGAAFAGMTRTEILVAGFAVATAAYSFLHLLVLLRREALAERLSQWRAGERAAVRSSLDAEAAPATAWYQRLGAAIAATTFVGPTDRARLTKALSEAGMGASPTWLATLVAIKLGALAAVAVAAWVALHYYGPVSYPHATILRFSALLAAGLAGWRLPDFVLLTIARRRKRRIEDSLPDALDLLVISAEAGLSLEQGIEFVGREMAKAMPELGEELRTASAELRVLGDRRTALQNFAARTGVPAARSIVSTLIQTMRYGTPLAQSLRVLAAEMRTARLLRMEARAARMPVLMTIPLMGFILPSLVMVVCGPAILQIIDLIHHFMDFMNA